MNSRVSFSDDQIVGFIALLITLACLYGVVRAVWAPPRHWFLAILSGAGAVFFGIVTWLMFFWKMTRLF